MKLHEMIQEMMKSTNRWEWGWWWYVCWPTQCYSTPSIWYLFRHQETPDTRTWDHTGAGRSEILITKTSTGWCPEKIKNISTKNGVRCVGTVAGDLLGWIRIVENRWESWPGWSIVLIMRTNYRNLSFSTDFSDLLSLQSSWFEN